MQSSTGVINEFDWRVLLRLKGNQRYGTWTARLFARAQDKYAWIANFC